jgi:hypothetical protein
MRQEDSTWFWWLLTSLPSGSKSIRLPAQRPIEYSTSWTSSCIATDYPHRIITDLGSNFNNHHFWEYYRNSGIDIRYVSVTHPRDNGQVERANGMVLHTLKKQLHDAANTKGGKWIKELPNAL